MKLKRFMSVLLCVAMIMGLMVTTSFAATKPDPVTLTKTATPVEGMVNAWEVELKVTATPDKTQGVANDVVLVIDNSNSMYPENWYDNNKRMTYAKNAAKEFVDQLLVDGSQSRVAIVVFGTGIVETRDFTSDKTTLETFINNISQNKNGDAGGTNLQAGIRKANELLASSTATVKSAVLLADGKPTYSYQVNGVTAAAAANQKHDYCGFGSHNVYSYITTKDITSCSNKTVGTGSNNDWNNLDVDDGYKVNNGATCSRHSRVADLYYVPTNHGQPTIWEAKQLASAGYDVYTVALLAGNDGNSVLQSCASAEDKAYSVKNEADIDKLSNVFQDIAGRIITTCKDASVHDIMGTGFVVNGTVNGATVSADGKTLDWNIGDVLTPEVVDGKPTGNYVASLKYTVYLDEDIYNAELVDGKYAVNQKATLTYNDDATKDFPVPTVDLTGVYVSKLLAGQDSGNFTISLGDTLGSVTVGATSISRTATMAEKISAAKASASTDVVYKTMSAGTVCTVSEAADANYDTTYYVMGMNDTTASAGNTFTMVNGKDMLVIVTNTYNEMIPVTVTKIWNDGENRDGVRPGSISVQLLDSSNSLKGTATLTAENATADGNWTYTWNVLKYDANGNVINYKVNEVNVDSHYTPTVDGMTITNTHNVDKVNVTVTKTWDDVDDQDGIRPESISVQLKANGTAVGEPVTIKADPTGAWTYTWKDQYANENGKPINYTVEEVSEAEGYTATYGTEELTITNTHVPATIEKLTMTKVWDDANNQDGIRPESISVQLKANGTAVGEPVPITADPTGAWTYTWNNLPVYADGEEIEYTVEEVGVADGYESTVEGMTITNTHEPKVVTIPVVKDWVGDTEATRPENITVNLLANGEVVQTITLTAKTQWTGAFENVPAYANGEAIDYDVEEVAVDGYTAAYNITAIGVAIVNTLVPVDPTPTPTPTPDPAPATGDSSNMGLYIALAVVALAGIAAVVIVPMKKRG